VNVIARKMSAAGIATLSAVKMQILKADMIWIMFAGGNVGLLGCQIPEGGDMRLTTRTNLAMRTLMFCAVNEGRVVRKHEVAAACNASENHLAQVIHLLAQQGFLKTVRGRAGGLQLGRAVDDIRVGEVFRIFESGLPFTECMTADGNSCPLAGCCRLKCALSEALDAFYATLDKLVLRDLVSGNCELEGLLKVA
jgi:Rrf2 family transcriptional regulator, nitric oxide-sensitive transcriptional repressor